MQKYRDNLTAEELASLNAELDALDAAYADAYDAEPCVPCDEEWEDDDPVKMGWVDRNGRP
jgi:hypothetical protein